MSVIHRSFAIDAIASLLNDCDLMRLAQSDRTLFYLITRNEKEWISRAEKKGIAIDPNRALSIFQQYVHPHRADVRIAAAEERGRRAAERILHPIYSSSDYTEETSAGPYLTAIISVLTGLGGTVSLYSSYEELTSKGINTSAILLGSGSAFLLILSMLHMANAISSPLPQNLGGKWAGLLAKTSIAARRWLNSPPVQNMKYQLSPLICKKRKVE